MLSKTLLFLLLAFCSATASVMSQSTLATANGFNFTTSDISPEARRLFDQQEKLIADDRRAVFDQWVFEEMLAMEAKTRGVSVEMLQAESMARVAKPTEVQIKAIYDGNRQSIGNRSLEEVRHNIVEYLSREAAERQMKALFDSLKTKYKYTLIKDPGLPIKAAEVAATIGTRQVTIGEFEIANRIALYNRRAGINESIRSDLENVIFTKLLGAEAKKRGVDESTLIAVEITNKLRDFTDYERLVLEDALQSKLFKEYAVKFVLPELEPQFLNVSADDDPSIGPPTAKVTVVMFVDFQCSSCASFSPLAKQVVSEFGAGARLVVRDFPLTEIHEQAMNAAKAGYAARQQGKFFELSEMMYRNQDALDRDSLIGYASVLGMDVNKFRTDMTSPAAAAEIAKDVSDGKNYGVNGTPAVFVNGVRLQRLSVGRLRNMIQNALK